MTIYEAVLNRKWLTTAKLLIDARKFVKANQETQNPEIAFEVTTTSIAIAIYYAHKNPDQLFNRIAHISYSDFAKTKHATLSILSASQAKTLLSLWHILAKHYFTNASAHHQKRNFSQAVEYFDKAHNFFKLANAVESLPIALFNQAMCLLENESSQTAENLTEAICIFQQTIVLLKLNDHANLSKCEYSIGICLVKQNKHLEAISHFESAAAFYPHQYLRERQEFFLKETATSLLTQQKYNLADYFFKLAKRTVENILPYPASHQYIH